MSEKPTVGTLVFGPTPAATFPNGEKVAIHPAPPEAKITPVPAASELPTLYLPRQDKKFIELVWNVDTAGPNEEYYGVSFTGDNARERAEEYAAFKNAQLAFNSK